MTGMDDKLYTRHPQLGSDQQQKNLLKRKFGSNYLRKKQTLTKDIILLS